MHSISSHVGYQQSAIINNSAEARYDPITNAISQTRRSSSIKDSWPNSFISNNNHITASHCYWLSLSIYHKFMICNFIWRAEWLELILHPNYVTTALMRDHPSWVTKFPRTFYCVQYWYRETTPSTQVWGRISRVPSERPLCATFRFR